MRDIGIAPGREPDVRRDERVRVISLTFRGIGDARSSVDRDTRSCKRRTVGRHLRAHRPGVQFGFVGRCPTAQLAFGETGMPIIVRGGAYQAHARLRYRSCTPPEELVAASAEWQPRGRHVVGQDRFSAQLRSMTPELARVVDVDDQGCTLAFTSDARVERVMFSADILRYAVPIRPGHLVLVADGVVVYRGPLATASGPDLDAVRERCLAEWQALAARHVINADPRRVVADGYNRIAERYAQWSRDEVVDETRPKYLSLLLGSLPPGAELLELGCGGGGPTTRQLANRFRLTGVDIAERQIELARQAVPSAMFLCDDMTRLSFPSASFDAIASFYAFNHLPFGELPGLLTRIADWLRPRGLLVTALARRYDPGTVEADWLGAPMYFSGYTSDESRRFVPAAGLAIVSLQPEPIIENGQATKFLWLVARKA